MQVDPFTPTLRPTGTKLLKLKHDILLSTSAFKFNLRRYNLGGRHESPQVLQRGLDLAARLVRADPTLAAVGRCMFPDSLKSVSNAPGFIA